MTHLMVADVLSIQKLPLTQFNIRVKGVGHVAERDPIFEKSIVQFAVSMGVDSIIYFDFEPDKTEFGGKKLSQSEEWYIRIIDMDVRRTITHQNSDIQAEIEYSYNINEREGFQFFILQMQLIAGYQLDNNIINIPDTGMIPDGSLKQSLLQQGIKGMICLPVKNEQAVTMGYLLLLGIHMPLWSKIYSEPLLEQLVYQFERFKNKAFYNHRKEYEEARKREISSILIKNFNNLIKNSVLSDKQSYNNFTSILSQMWQAGNGILTNLPDKPGYTDDILLKTINNIVLYAQLKLDYIKPNISYFSLGYILDRVFNDWLKMLSENEFELIEGELFLQKEEIIYTDIELLMVVLGCFAEYFIMHSDKGRIVLNIKGIEGYLVFSMKWQQPNWKVKFSDIAQKKYLSTSRRRIHDIEDFLDNETGMELSIAKLVSGVMNGLIRLDTRKMPYLSLEFLLPLNRKRKLAKN